MTGTSFAPLNTVQSSSRPTVNGSSNARLEPLAPLSKTVQGWSATPITLSSSPHLRPSIPSRLPVGERTLFRCVAQGHAIKLRMSDKTWLPDPNVVMPSTAVGVASISQGVGMYFQTDSEYCVCAHITIIPMLQRTDWETRNSAENTTIERRTVHLLNEVAGKCFHHYRHTLLIVNPDSSLGSSAIIDGILEWAGIFGKVKAMWRKENVNSASGFVVPQPRYSLSIPKKFYPGKKEESKWEPIMVYGEVATGDLSLSGIPSITNYDSDISMENRNGVMDNGDGVVLDSHGGTLPKRAFEDVENKGGSNKRMRLDFDSEEMTEDGDGGAIRAVQNMENGEEAERRARIAAALREIGIDSGFD